jgi:ATPase components of ABC transporters with duplicated ATPase domains
MILSCNNLRKSFGSTDIILDASFHIEDREKVSVVGINGAGKSTLLKMIIGELSADSGNIILSKGKTIGYLSQHQDLNGNFTIYEEILSVKQNIIDLELQIRETEQLMKTASDEQLDNLLKDYSNLNHKFEMLDGYSYKSMVTGIIKGLGFTNEEFNKPVKTLSGGQKTRVALGKLLLTAPDLILLDEPTNHLDINAVAWLETFLLNYTGSVIIVAHDRYFLDKVVSKVIEIENAKVMTYMGNYTAYSEKKAMLRAAILNQYINQQQEIKHHEEVITKLRSFNREKSIKRAESREKMLSKMDKADKPVELNASMNITLETNILSGNDVLTIRSLSKSFGNNCLFSDVDIDIKRGERIAIVGGNGTGKTTFLKTITKTVTPDNGDIILGTNVNIGYYDQEHQVLNVNKTLFDELQDTYPNLNNTKIRNILAAFLFTGDDAFKYIKDLSGGERGRVSLAKLILSKANFLILDEPTNHLDITSKEILENALNNYTGTILYVSHDRYFINKTATRILDLTQNNFVSYIGNYDYFMQKKAELSSQTLDTLDINNNVASNQNINSINSDLSKLDWKAHKEDQAKQRKRKNDLKKIEFEIEKLEIENLELDEILTKEDVFSNVSKLMMLTTQKNNISEQLSKLYEEWEELAK